jgi:hypothetical protein
MIVTIPGFWVDMVMPFTNEGRIDPLGIVKLLAFLESQGVETVVVGSNFGEGQFELGKDWRVVFKALQKGKGKLRVVVCVDYAKRDHMNWMVRQVNLAELDGILVYPPSDPAEKEAGSVCSPRYILLPWPGVKGLEIFIPVSMNSQQSMLSHDSNPSDKYLNGFTVGGKDEVIIQVSRWGNLGAYHSEDGPCSIHAVKEELKRRGIIARAFQLQPR